MQQPHTYVSRTNPGPECQMFVISLKLLLVSPPAQRNTSNLTPLNQILASRPSPQTKIYFTPVFSLLWYVVILSFFLLSYSGPKILGSHLRLSSFCKTHIQLISKFLASAFKPHIRNASSFFLCCFCCSSPGYSSS